MDDEPVADPIDPSFFDFDNGEPLSRERLKGRCRATAYDLRFTALDRINIPRSHAEATARDLVPDHGQQSVTLDVVLPSCNHFLYMS